MEYRILGPLEVFDEGRELPLGPAKERAVLGMLLLHAGSVVSRTQLIDGLWGESPPPTATRAVNVYVSQVRKTLSRNGDETIVTRTPGYLLSVQEEALDAARFQRLAAAARERERAGELEAAAALMREALGLWRGSALAGVELEGNGLDDVARLDELRLAAQLDLVDYQLALGEHEQLVPELERLVAHHRLDERLRGQLMLALYRSGRQAEALQAYRETRETLVETLGIEPGAPLQRLEKAILNHDPSLEAPSGVARDLVICPFKGLASFEADDADYFCGRDRIVADLVARLADASLVGIVGASGVGKSSILRAGMLRRLSGGVLPGSERWRVALMRPGTHPSAELKRVLDGPGDGRLVVAVDQLEEVFTLGVEDEQKAFLDALAELAADARAHALVIVSLRADYYGRCAESAAFAELLSRNHVLVGAMERDELVQAIGTPARRAGFQVEPALVDRLVEDVAGEPGGLPLLSTTLLELWRHSDGRTLRLATYRAAGGVRGAVARLAEAAFAELSEPEQYAARTIMLRLTVGEGYAAAGRRLPLSDFAHDERVAGVLEQLVDTRLLTVDDGTVEVAHEALLREWPRLRAWLDEDREGRRLHAHMTAAARDWDERGRDRADLYRGARLSAALDWWEEHDPELNERERGFITASRDEREHELLLQRRRSRRLLALVAGVAALLVLAVAAGVVALRQRRTARNEATVALARDLGATAVSERRIDRAMLLARQAVALNRSPQTEGTLLATLLRSPAAIAAFTGPIDSRPQRISVSPDGGTIAVADNNAVVRFYDPLSRRVRRAVRNLGYGYPPVYARDGSFFVAAGALQNRPAVDVRDARTNRVIRRLSYDHRWLTQPTGPSANFVLTRDGRTAFSAYPLLKADSTPGAGYVERWDLTSGRVSTAPVGADGTFELRLVDGDRRLIVLGAGVVTVLNERTMRPVRTVRLPRPQTGVVDQSVSPDGRTAVVQTAPGQLSFVDLASGMVRRGAGTQTAAISGLSFAPDSSVVVTGGEDGSLVVWDVRTATATEQLTGHGGRVVGIAFSNDGMTLYTCSLDGAIFEWDLGSSRRFGRSFSTTATPARPHLSDDASVQPPPLAVSPDGSRYAVRVHEAEVAIYATRDSEKLAQWSPPIGPELTGLAWSRQGQLALIGDEGRLQLWKTDGRPRLVRRLSGLRSANKLPELVTSVTFSPDGSLLAAGDLHHTPFPVHYRYGTVAVWDSGSGRLLWRERSRRGTVTAVAFSPDGATLAAGYENGVAVLYDAHTGRPLRTVRLQGGGNFSFETLAFSPGGLLATGTWAGIVQLWNPSTGQEVGRPTLVAAAPVASISFDPTGDTFATTGGSDGLAKLWRTSTLQQFGATFPGDPGRWGSAAYAPDGSRLVVSYGDGTGDVWPTSLAEWEEHACAVAGRNLTQEEWRRFVGSRSYAKTCG